jgi:hypothetical protein
MRVMAEKARRGKKPLFHHTYTRQHTKIAFNNNKEKINNCFAFTTDRKEILAPWNIPQIFYPTKRSSSARLGTAGGKTVLPSSSLVWYIDGFLVPELYLRKGLTYINEVEGGSNPRSAEFYHPFVITDESIGGIARLTDKQTSKIR